MLSKKDVTLLSVRANHGTEKSKGKPDITLLAN
jgi:hypothetical protein